MVAKVKKKVEYASFFICVFVAEAKDCGSRDPGINN